MEPNEGRPRGTPDQGGVAAVQGHRRRVEGAAQAEPEDQDEADGVIEAVAGGRSAARRGAGAAYGVPPRTVRPGSCERIAAWPAGRRPLKTSRNRGG